MKGKDLESVFILTVTILSVLLVIGLDGEALYQIIILCLYLMFVGLVMVVGEWG